MSEQDPSARICELEFENAKLRDKLVRSGERALRMAKEMRELVSQGGGGGGGFPGSLLDWFAGQIAAGTSGNPIADLEAPADAWAKSFYIQAQAMIAEKARLEGQSSSVADRPEESSDE